MDKDSCHGRRRGRPPRNDIETVSTIAWFKCASHKLGKNSGYAFEQKFCQGKISTRDDGSIQRPRRFDYYKSGLHTPNRSAIDMVDEACSGTKAIIELPLWEVTRSPCTDLNKLYAQLHRLRPELVDLLFYRIRNGASGYERRQIDYMTTFQTLKKEGDIEALTACIGLIQEAKYYGYEAMDFMYTKPTFAVFRRAVSESPLYLVAEEFFEYFMEHILNTPAADEIRTNVSSEIINGLIWSTIYRLDLIDDLRILRSGKYPPRSCLHIAERYLTIPVIREIGDLQTDDQWDGIYNKLPAIRNLTRALKRWETKNMPVTRH